MALSNINDARVEMNASLKTYSEASDDDKPGLFDNTVAAIVALVNAMGYSWSVRDVACVQQLFTQQVTRGHREMVRQAFGDTTFHEPRVYGPCTTGEDLQLVPDGANVPFTHLQEVIRDDLNGFTFFGNQIRQSGNSSHDGFDVMAAFTHDPNARSEWGTHPQWRSGTQPNTDPVYLGIFSDELMKPERLYLIGGATGIGELAADDVIFQGCSSPLDKDPNEMDWEDIITIGPILVDGVINQPLNLMKMYHGFRLKMTPIVQTSTHTHARIRTFHLYGN